MIEINLLSGARKKRGGGGLKLPDFKALAGSIKDPYLIACVVLWVAFLAMIGAVYLPRRSARNALVPVLEAKQHEADHMKSVLKTKRDAELKADTLRAQIAVIRDIDRERYIWPHMLDAITKALPPYTWLDDISSRPGEADSSSAGVALTIHGKSADIQAITRFVRNLEESPFLQGATQVSTTVVTERGRDVYDYVLAVKYQQPDTNILTLQPLAASLVQGYRSGSARPPTRTGR
ncbi:MAG: PilN domain-containing protein [Gemmatimonadales bacterium]